MKDPGNEAIVDPSLVTCKKCRFAVLPVHAGSNWECHEGSASSMMDGVSSTKAYWPIINIDDPANACGKGEAKTAAKAGKK